MNNDFNNNLSLDYDMYFNSALKNGLTWYPWIGKNYPNAKYKLLVVAESHYASDNERTQEQQMHDIDNVADNKNFTREVVDECWINRLWSNRTLDNINRILVGQNNFDGKLLWKYVAFYNFIQRPMATVNERPTWDEFSNGWRNFIDILKVIKPNVVIFIGNTAANFFNEAMSTLNIPHSKMEMSKFINSAWAKYASVTLDETTIPIYSIRHAGRYFSWPVWHDYLSEKLSNMMKYLKSLVDVDENPSIIEDNQEEYLATNASSMSVPMHLSHCPIIATDYQALQPADSFDAKFISIGRAQYNNNEISVKVLRYTGTRWSRQSEEVPIQRLGYMMEMLLAGILHCQSEDESNFQTELGEKIISPQDIDFLREQIRENRHAIFESLNRIRAMIDEIDPEKI